MPQKGVRVPGVKTCPVTRLPAKYLDPVTQLPYANLQAFKIIREAYYQQLEAKGDRSDPEIATWLEWRAKNKSNKPILTSVNRPPASYTSLAAGTVNRAVGGVQKQVLQQQPSIVQQQQLVQQPQGVVQQPGRQSVVLPSRGGGGNVVMTSTNTVTSPINSATSVNAVR